MAGEGKDAEGPTVKAVIAAAARIRERAAKARVGDPYARLYEPSEATARKLSQELGPADAISELLRRELLRSQEYREASMRSERAALRLLRQHAEFDRERAARRAGMTLGQRLDEAIANLALVSDVAAAALDGQVSGGSSSGEPVPQKDKRIGNLVEQAHRVVEGLEDELPRVRRRLGSTA